ncbi:MAG: hypothetical protein OES25_13895 [Acidobacteriota bacterium]|nr:hypothetical protein [Acidobacteriota bacterium]
MKHAPPPWGLQLAAAFSIALGPFGAWLYESGHLDLFGDAYLLNLWVVVALAIAGMVVGAFAVFRGARLLGVGSLVLNSGVAALYGFLGVFFSLGGTR